MEHQLRRVLRVTSAAAHASNDETRQYWRTRPVSERLAAVEFFRRQYDGTGARLRRVLRIVGRREFILNKRATGRLKDLADVETLGAEPEASHDGWPELSRADSPRAALRTERVLSASPREVFAAFEQPDRLARWWGPSGFTNTFDRFEFEPGGRWIFVMHGPNGAHYPNESVFREILPNTRIVIEHVSKPWFELTVALTARGHQTHLAWVQEFESPEVAAKMRPLSGTANEQVLDRLEALLANRSEP